MSDKIVIIVQARAGGSRFPGKVLAPLLGQPMLLWQLDRLSRVGGTLVVASPSQEESYAIRDLCNKHGYNWLGVGGDENDVLNRYAVVAKLFDADHIVRVTADCPLIDPMVIDTCLDTYYHCPLYASNIAAPRYAHVGIGYGWPDGQDCEIFSRESLTIAHNEATTLSDREHVTPFIYRNTDRFRTHAFPCPFDLSWQQYSVDTPENLRDVEAILQTCLARYGTHHFGWREIWQTIELLQPVKARMVARKRNQAYVEQVEKETGATGLDWGTIRHGTTDTCANVKEF